MSSRGSVRLDWPVDDIQVGQRHRQDMGDLDELIGSIQQLGMLQPITIAPHGTLICGARRLAAVKQLGWKQVNVWVRAGISTPLQQLLAEQHDNTIRKSLTPSEAGALYTELKTLIAEDAARRQQASRFGADHHDHAAPHGGAESAPPSGKTRAQAARMVTGTQSYTRLEQVAELQALAVDPTLSTQLRQLVAEALEDIDADGKVNGHYQRVKLVLAGMPADADPTQILHAMADQAVAEVNARQQTPKNQPTDADQPRGPRRYGVRAFVLTWAELTGWTDHYDPHEIGPALNTEQWDQFEAAVASTVAFADSARAARAAC